MPLRLIYFLMLSATIFLVSCDEAQQSQEIISILEPKRNCKRTTTKIYSSTIGFCSNSIFLNSDFTYLKEGGCEGRSHITVGKWKIVGDSIELQSVPIANQNLICDIQLSANTKYNLKTTFYIIDKTGKPIPNFIILPLNVKEKYKFTSDPSVVFNSVDRKIKVYKTDDSGKATADLSNCDTLEFPQLKNLTEKKYQFSAKNLTDTIRITMDINAEGFSYSNISYEYWDKPVRYKILENKLTNGNFILTEKKR